MKELYLIIKQTIEEQRAKGKNIIAWKGRPIDRKAAIWREYHDAGGRIVIKYKMKYDPKVYESELQRVKENSF